MPLPPALLARLRKRGIVSADAQEEIIAESYDDDQSSGVRIAAPDKAALYASGCPNKNNPYHQCVEFCNIHWGEGVIPESRRGPIYERRRQRMLRRYPLPSADWKEIYDPGVGRYYYWNMETDEVCWLSPTHPRARIGPAAPKLAKDEWDKLIRDRKAQDDRRKRQKQVQQEPPPRGRGRGRRRSVSPESDKESEASIGSESDGDPLDEERERAKRKKPAKRKLPSDLDPMDPAAYSEIPRGGWSAGLEMRGDAKTGVDTTASGPLFQQRPYPAPGAILRQNKDVRKPPQRKGPQIGPADPRKGYDSD